MGQKHLSEYVANRARQQVKQEEAGAKEVKAEKQEQELANIQARKRRLREARAAAGTINDVMQSLPEEQPRELTERQKKRLKKMGIPEKLGGGNGDLRAYLKKMFKDDEDDATAAGASYCLPSANCDVLPAAAPPAAAACYAVCSPVRAAGQ